MGILIDSASPEPSKADSTAVCFHCYEPLAKNPPGSLMSGEKSFCCSGCKTVYEILAANDLCQYYTLDNQGGNRIEQQRNSKAYTWLDDPETAARLVDFNDTKRAKVTFYLPEMHCAACIWLLEHLYRLDSGISRSVVNFPRKTVSIDFNPGQTSLRQIATALAGIGYPPEINLSDIAHTAPKAVAKTMYYKIGVAGFAFGNIMLLSFPEYLGLKKATDGHFFSVFGYLNLLFALPVLLYSASDYLRSAWNSLRNQHLSIDLPVSLGILMLFGRSTYEILTGTGAGYMDSFSGLIFFLLCGKWVQQKTFYHLSFERDYRSYFPVSATIRKNNTETTTPLSKLSPGDTIIIRNGELIPADGVLIRGDGRVDYSFVTGEAALVALKNGEKIFAGGRQCGDRIEITLTRTVSQSYLTQLWNDHAFSTEQPGATSEIADRAGRWFTRLILVVGSAAFVYWWLFRGEIGVAVNAFTAIFMVACPCAIAVSIPFTLGNVLHILGKNRFYIKNIKVLEAFSGISSVVMDKTGTITTRTGHQTEGLTFFKADTTPGNIPMEHLDKKTLIQLKSITYLSNHPSSQRILAAIPVYIPLFPVRDFKEYAGKGISGTIDGKCVRLGSSEFIFETADPAAEGIFLQIGDKIAGHFSLSNRYRKGLDRVIQYWQKQCPDNVRLLSGDHDQAAAELSRFFPTPGSMLFRKSPQDKLDYIKRLQQSGKQVLFLGDGLNDAGALRQSDIGIVVSENTNNFTPASDAILDAEVFDRLPVFIAFIKASLTVVKASFLLALCYNLVGLSYAVTGTLSPLVAAILMPLSSVTIVIIGILGSEWYAWRFLSNDQSHSAA